MNEFAVFLFKALKLVLVHVEHLDSTYTADGFMKYGQKPGNVFKHPFTSTPYGPAYLAYQNTHDGKDDENGECELDVDHKKHTDKEEHPQGFHKQLVKSAGHGVVDIFHIIDNQRNDVAGFVPVIVGYWQTQGMIVKLVAHVPYHVQVEPAGNQRFKIDKNIF